MWAEEFGIGEMGLSPQVFWALTVREFWIKWHAWVRGQDRQRALMLEHGLMVGRFDLKGQRSIERTINALRRYPLKRWLLPEPPA